MKNEFIKILKNDEEILFYGIADVSKTSKQCGRFLLGLAILVMFWILVLIGIKSDELLDFYNLIIFLTLSLLTIGLIYGLVYNIFLKYKRNKNEYFVTNKRIALYNSKCELRIENICDIEHIGIAREKNNYGDITFNFYANNLIDQMKNGMSFEGVENPRKIAELISDINKNIHIYDDRPTIMGKKI